MKNIDEKILMAEEEIKQLQNKRKKLINQQKQKERKKRNKRLYEKGGVFESIFTESIEEKQTGRFLQRTCHRDRKSTRLTPVTDRSRMPSSA